MLSSNRYPHFYFYDWKKLLRSRSLKGFSDISNVKKLRLYIIDKDNKPTWIVFETLQTIYYDFRIRFSDLLVYTIFVKKVGRDLRIFFERPKSNANLKRNVENVTENGAMAFTMIISAFFAYASCSEEILSGQWSII